jgi:hypothetical protein
MRLYNCVEILSLEALQANEELQLLQEEHSGSMEIDGTEAAILFGLESPPEESFRQKKEARRSARNRWS